MQRLLFIVFCLFALELSAGTRLGQKSFTFIQLSDPQMGFMSANKDVEAEERLYEETIEYINRTSPAFVVITGDFVNNRNSESQREAFKRITTMIDPKIPVYYSPGNHDLGQIPTAEAIESYRKNYPHDRFCFEYGGCVFIGLNSCYIKSGVEQEQDQLEWFRRSMSKYKGKRKVIFTHYPFFTKEIDEKDTYSNIETAKRKSYFQLFSDNCVELVLAGHYHNNAEGSWNGVRMITTSAIGKQLGRVKPGFREVVVSPDTISERYVEIGTGSVTPMSFLLLGDLHYDKLEHHDMEWLSQKPGDLRQVTKSYVPNTERNRSDFMLKLSQQIESELPVMRAIVQMGDLSEGLAGNPQKAEEMAHAVIAEVGKANMPIPWVLSKGNHDITGPGAPDAFQKIYTPFIRQQVNNPTIENATYSYRQGEALFVVLDLWDKKIDPLAFLEREFTTTNARYKFVVLHEPIIPVTERCWHYMRQYPDKREQLLQILGRNRAIVLCAHLHRYSVVRRTTPYGPIVQVMVNSVIGDKRESQPSYCWSLSDYGQGLVDKRSFDEKTLEQRRTMLADEARYVTYYKCCDLPGYGVLKIDPMTNEIVLEYYAAFGSEPFDRVVLSELK